MKGFKSIGDVEFADDRKPHKAFIKVGEIDDFRKSTYNSGVIIMLKIYRRINGKMVPDSFKSNTGKIITNQYPHENSAIPKWYCNYIENHLMEIKPEYFI